MRIRHKVPPIFSLSMVDMLCCALGCVILVWLLNAKVSEDEAEEREKQIEETARLLLDAERKNSAETDRTRALSARVEKYEQDYRRLAERLAGLQTNLAEEKEAVKDLRGKLLASERRGETLSTELKKAGTSAATLTGNLARMEKDYRAEREKAERLQKLIDEKLARLAALEKKLEESSAAGKTLAAKVSERDKELALLRLMRERYEKLLEREKALDRKILEQLALLAEADKDRVKLRKEKDAALTQAEAEKLALEQLRKLRLSDLARLEKEKLVLRQAADNRFAGITLTGKRAIFLVDMSGSMTMIDQENAAPKKWPEVCRTVAQLMKSLPDLEKYQVIGFGAEVLFPLGRQGEWIEHDPKRSPEQTQKALEAIKPKGGTNMYAALDEAFRYRESGLDTIYVLSDGLPNQGEGLTLEQRRTLTDLERGGVLGRYIRTTLRKRWNAAGGSRPRVKINTIGFFFESPDLGAFLWALARENDGSFVGMSKP